MSDPTIHIVIGLGFGDEGKGSVVDKLCASTGADLVVRHNGGAQAAHNVVCPDGTHHTFAQFGSGSFIPEVRTLLSKYMMVNPGTFLVEARVLKSKGVEVKDRVIVDERAFITTPYHVQLNRARELARGVARHGTTGLGISETVIDSLARKDAIRCGDLVGPGLLQKVKVTRDALMPEMERLGARAEFERILPEAVVERFEAFLGLAVIFREEHVNSLLQNAKGIVFEGAQGVLLDENYGFHPHTTWSKTTPINAYSILKEAGGTTGAIRAIGVTRTYATRHGAGPFPTEDPAVAYPEPHNGDDGMAGQFRQGWLDLHLLKYARDCAGTSDYLAVNHCDCNPVFCCHENPYLDTKIPHSTRDQEALCRQAWKRVDEDHLWSMPSDIADMISEELKIPLLMRGAGMSRDAKVILK